MSANQDIEMGNMQDDTDESDEEQSLLQACLPVSNAWLTRKPPADIRPPDDRDIIVIADCCHINVIDLASGEGSGIPPLPKQTRTPEENLFLAVCKNDVEEINSYISAEVDPNMINPCTLFNNLQEIEVDLSYELQARLLILYTFGITCTPLHVAASFSWEGGVRVLLEAGANPNIHDNHGRTPLDLAGVLADKIKRDPEAPQPDDSKNFSDVIHLLIQAGGRPATTPVGCFKFLGTPLHVAVELKNANAFKQLIQVGANAGSFNGMGETPLHMCVRSQFIQPFKVAAEVLPKDTLEEILDLGIRDRNSDHNGYSVLHMAVVEGWLDGVCIALDHGADVTKMARNGETPIHSAAGKGNLDVLKKIIIAAKKIRAVDNKNEIGQSALFKAVTNGHLDCVKAILEEQPKIELTLINGVNVLHEAAKNGYIDVFTYTQARSISQSFYYALTFHSETEQFSPLHYAISRNHLECVDLIMSSYWNIDRILLLRTGKGGSTDVVKDSTPLHIAAVYNHASIAELLISKEDYFLLLQKNSVDERPLHTAIKHSSRDVIKVLLHNGADLAGYYCAPGEDARTTIDMLINYLSEPTQFLEEVFDSYISTNDKNLFEPGCEVKIDYRVLMPKDNDYGGWYVCDYMTKMSKMSQMRLIKRLLETGNRYSQANLLVHPLLESFLHLKWNALIPFFYLITVSHSLFVMSLTILSYSMFYYKDIKEEKPSWLNSTAWSILTGLFIFVIVFQEFLLNRLFLFNIFQLVFKCKCSKLREFIWDSCNLYNVERWTKVGCIMLAIVLSLAPHVEFEDAQWPRHVATLAIPLAWIHLMILISRFPYRGHYVLIFGRVTRNVMKVLLLFGFLLVGFSVSFTIQYRSKPPFDGPISSFIKTVVMMTSEFEYGLIFDATHSKELASFQIGRFIFIIFLVLTSIVLMNLMIGVAVSDINDLERLGNVQRLKRQVQNLVALESLAHSYKFLAKCFNIKMRGNISNEIKLSPGKMKVENDKILPEKIQDKIFRTAQAVFEKNNKSNVEKEQMDNVTETFKCFEDRLEKIEKGLGNELTTIKEQVKMITRDMTSTKGQITTLVEETMNTKDQIMDLVEASMKDQFTAMAESVRSTNGQITTLTEDMSSTKVYIANMSKEISNTKDQIKTMADDIKLALEVVKQLSAKLNEGTSRYE